MQNQAGARDGGWGGSGGNWGFLALQQDHSVALGRPVRAALWAQGRMLLALPGKTERTVFPGAGPTLTDLASALTV